jgi:type VI protein secretion system component VasF
MSDEVSKKIEQEVGGLKDKLQDRLKETEEIGDLESGLQKQSHKLNKTTEEHQDISRETRNRMWFKYAKWTALIVILCLLLAWFVIKPIINLVAFCLL